MALGQVWQDPQARHFTVFMALSILAYSAEEILLEPFAGSVFGLDPARSEQLTGLQHGGALVGMLLVALSGGRLSWALRGWSPSLRDWTVGGCMASAMALAVLALAGATGQSGLLRGGVLALGLGNGIFAVAAIGSMMPMAGGTGARGCVQIGL